MNYSRIQIQQMLDSLRETYEKNGIIKILNIDYIGIEENQIATLPSKFCTVFDNSHYGVIFICYEYLRVSNKDRSFFILFLSDNWIGDTIKENGWTMSFDTPITAINITHGRTCYISKGDLKLSLFFNSIYSVKNKIGMCFLLFKNAQNCTTQQELDFLYKISEQGIEIESLNKQLIKEKTDEYYKNKEIEGYKGMLENIKALIDGNK